MLWRLAVEAGSQALHAPTVPTLPDARRWRRAGIRLVLALIVAGFVSLAIQWVVDHGNAPWPSAVRNNYVALTISVVLTACMGLALWRRAFRWTEPVTWALLSAATTLPLAFALMGTRYYFGGVSIDQNFRTQYLTRMTSSPQLADFAYHGLAPYYPISWFWLGGRFANIFGLPGWAAFKPWSIVWLALVAVVTYELWSLMLRRRPALLCALMTLVLCIVQGAEEPYSWTAAAMIPPLTVLAWRWVSALARERGRPEPGSWGVAIAVGAFLGIFGDLYTLYMLFFALLLVVLGAIAIWRGWRAGDGATLGSVFGRVLTRYLLLGAVAVVVLLPVWGLYLLAMLRGEHGTNAALHYLPSSAASVPAPMLQFNLVGALCFIGAVWMVVQVRRNVVATGLGIGVAVCYLWYFLSYAALLAHTTLLAFRLYNVLTVLVSIAGLFGGIALIRFVAELLPSRKTQPTWVAGLVMLGSIIVMVQGAPVVSGKDRHAFGDYYPTGVTPVGRSNPSDADYWVPKLNATIRGLTGRAPRHNIILSAEPILTITSPYWSFQASTPHYANPLAQWETRNAHIEAWADEPNSHALATRMRRERPQDPNVLVLKRTKQGYAFSTAHDVFPAQPNVAGHKVTFAPKLFSGPEFAHRDVGPFTVVALRDAPPVR